MRSIVLAALAIVSIASVGCGGDGAPAPDGGSNAIATPEAFCTALFDAICPRVGGACGCGSEAAATCRAEQTACTERVTSAAFRDALAAGRITFSSEAAAALVSRVSDGAPCDPWKLRAGWTVRDALGFGGVFVGTSANGAACAALALEGELGPSECANGTCVEGRCSEWVEQGESCASARTCAELDTPLSDDQGPPYDVECGDDGVCAPRRPNGAECELDTQCETLRCDADAVMCGPIVDVGACTINAECESEHCFGNCLSPTAFGEPCFRDVECESYSCDATGRCGERICRSYR